MFERIVPNIVPPEMAALLLDFKQPKIKGFMFRRHSDGLYYGADGVKTILRSKARIYDMSAVISTTRSTWSWGCKDQGHWVVVYE